MSGPAPRTLTLRGRLLVAAPTDDAFPLFSPDGERRWVPGWNPEILHPTDGTWQRGQIFRTREDSGEVVWIVTRFDAAQHEAEYHRVEPGRYVSRIEVCCRSAGEAQTEVFVAYTLIGLSEAGNRDIAAMTPEEYAEKMTRWAKWIDDYLAAGSAR